MKIKFPPTLITFILVLITTIATADKPVIGITMNYSEPEDRTPRVTLTIKTIDAITEAGGLPVLLPPLKSEEDIDRFVKMMDGFVFTGGADMNPARYGQEKHETTNILPVRREDFDLRLMKKVLASDKPVLGICLGMQQMNIACNGTLIQDIPSQTDSTLIHKGEGSGHDVVLEEGTRLHELMRGETFAVNSIHHQAVGETGDGLVITARSPDGIVEGIEKNGHPFAIGVQWHPEYLTEETSQMNLFHGLVEASSRGMNSEVENGQAAANP